MLAIAWLNFFLLSISQELGIIKLRNKGILLRIRQDPHVGRVDVKSQSSIVRLEEDSSIHI